MRSGWRACAVAALLLLLPAASGIALGADPPSDVVESGPSMSATASEVSAYADAFDLTAEEAVRRLAIQDEAGDLEAVLAESMDESFAGLWIEHEPELRVVVATTSLSSATTANVERTAATTEVASNVATKTVKYSLAELEADQAAMTPMAQKFKLTTSIDVMGNRVIVTPTDKAGAAALRRAALPPTVEADLRIHVARPAADAYAGASLSNGCTSGFTLVYTTTNPDTYFTSTAGHCGNTATLNGVSITFSSEIFAGNYDLQYGPVRTLIPRNQMRVSSTTLRLVKSRTTKSGQAINSYICKYGKTTGQTCGYLVSKSFKPSYVPSAAPGFNQVAPQGGPDMVNGGDSGGPVYKSFSAWGIVSGEYGLPWCVCDLIYDPIPYAEGNGLEPMQPLHVYYVP
jgi:hypothetical protein